MIDPWLAHVRADPADIGWITGHSYIVYGPMANGCTSVMYEGAPDYPGKDVWWQIIEQYRVSIFYTAPTAIRAFMKWGPEYSAKRDLSSLRLIESVLVAHPAVTEAAVIAVSDDLTGQAVVAYVTVGVCVVPGPGLEADLREHVATHIGKLARPKQIVWAHDVPKTRSGKITR